MEKNEISLIEKEMAEKPIIIPKNPFQEVFVRFGRDEACALLANAGSTALVSYLLGNYATSLTETAKKSFLSISGPIMEKFGFFIPYTIKTMKKRNSAEEKQPILTEITDIIRGGGKSLAEDVMFHDPMYIAGMYAGLSAYPETPAWMISALSFLGAVAGVSVGEVAYNELAYLNQKRKLKKAGFEEESYFESRFFIRADANPEKTLESIAQEFELGEIKKGNYHDKYFKCTLPSYNGRISKVRLRRRDQEDGNGQVQTAQIIFTRASELKNKQTEQFRYFPVRKDKLYHRLNGEMPLSIEDIEDERVRKALTNSGCTEKHEIEFERTAAFNPDKILASVDHVNFDRPFYVVELKSYPGHTDMLKEAMRYVMREFPVVQTTHGKSDMARVNGYK